MTHAVQPDLLAEMVSLIPRLRAYARALVRSPTAVDDCVQETLLRAIARQSQFQRGTDLRAWLFTIQHNHVVSAVRRDAHRANLLVAAGPLSDACAPRQEGYVELAMVREHVSDLDAAQRDLLLASITGASYQELADQFRIPIGTVRSRLNRTRIRLKNKIEERAHATALQRWEKRAIEVSSGS